MILNSPYVSGSLTVTGNITALGGISISGSIASASYAANAELLDGLDSSVFVLSSSFQNYSSSNDGKVAALNTFSASILSYTSSTDAKIAQLNRETASLNLATASLNNATASLYAATASIYNFTSSANLRIGSLEQYTQSLNTRSASFACVNATNNFACTQYFSNTSNAVSFTSTGSLYSDGGVRITRDMYVSGTAFFNNVTVFGTQSINYISSSQLNIASNIISVNTAMPTIRFGGLAVYDSGSLGTGLTGSLLWDSEDNQWIYSNPSGSVYDSALFLVGPRNTGALGSEVGISCNFLSKGNGMHHMTSSGIFEDGSRTCFYGNSRIDSSGNICNAGSVCSNNIVLSTGYSAAATASVQIWQRTGGAVAADMVYNDANTSMNFGTSTAHALNIKTNNSTALNINSAGVSSFFNTVCAPIFVGTTNVNTGTSCVVDSHMININGDQASVNVGLALRNTNISFPKVYGLTNVNNNLNLYDYTANSQRLRIDTNGIACFACQVCTPGMDIMPSGIGSNTLGGIMRVVTTGTSAGIAVGQSNANRYTHIAANDIQVFNDDFFLSTRCAFPLSIGTCYTARLTFAATGVACFSCQVCAPIMSAACEFRLGASFSRVAIADPGSGAFSGGYNYNFNSGTPQHDSTGALSAYYYDSGGAIRFFTNSSQAAGTAACERVRITSGGIVLIGTANTDIGGSVVGIGLAPNGRVLASISETGTLCHIFMGDRRGVSNEGPVFMMMRGGFFKSAIGVLGTAGITNDGGITFSTICGNDTITERIRITSGGILGFNGNSSPGNALLDKMSMGYLNSNYGWIQTWNGTPLILNREGNNVGINTSVPSTKLSVNSGISVSSANAISIMQNTNGANKDAAAFGVSIQNGGESTNAADLYISTATGGSLCERMRITSGG